MKEIVLDRVENTVDNRENAGCQDFLFFPSMFSKAFFSRSLNLEATL